MTLATFTAGTHPRDCTGCPACDAGAAAYLAASPARQAELFWEEMKSRGRHLRGGPSLRTTTSEPSRKENASMPCKCSTTRRTTTTEPPPVPDTYGLSKQLSAQQRRPDMARALRATQDRHAAAMHAWLRENAKKEAAKRAAHEEHLRAMRPFTPPKPYGDLGVNR